MKYTAVQEKDFSALGHSTSAAVPATRRPSTTSARSAGSAASAASARTAAAASCSPC